MPKELSYSLRFSNELRNFYGTWLTDKLHPATLGLENLRDDFFNEGGPPCYSCEGFVQIQDAIARAFVKLKSGNQMTPEVLLQRFPIPARVDNIVREAIVGIIARYSFFLILLAYALVCMNTVRDIVMEKENQLSEMMKIMGLTSSLQWSAWSLTTMLCLSISTVFIVIMLSVSSTNSQFHTVIYLI